MKEHFTGKAAGLALRPPCRFRRARVTCLYHRYLAARSRRPKSGHNVHYKETGTLIISRL